MTAYEKLKLLVAQLDAVPVELRDNVKMSVEFHVNDIRQLLTDYEDLEVANRIAYNISGNGVTLQFLSACNISGTFASGGAGGSQGARNHTHYHSSGSSTTGPDGEALVSRTVPHQGLAVDSDKNHTHYEDPDRT